MKKAKQEAEDKMLAAKKESENLKKKLENAQ